MFFERDDSPWGFSPHRYRCCSCGEGQRIVHIAHVTYPFEGCVNHLTFKCLKCFEVVTHSIPITEDYRAELVRRRGGTTGVYAPWSSRYQNDTESFFSELTAEEEEEVRKRLKELGYL